MFGWQDLKDLFKDVGGVVSADVVMGRDGRSRGWGVVNMESEDDAQRAIQVFMSDLTVATKEGWQRTLYSPEYK